MIGQSEGREPPTRKEREKRARQQQILKAARELFVTKGFRETTLEEIAHLAEFGKGTLYNYFASKEDLFIGIIEQSADEMSAIARESVAASSDVREQLRLYAKAIIRYVKDNGELLHVVYHELHRSDAPGDAARLREIILKARGVWAILAEAFRKGILSGTLRNADPEQLAVLFDGMLRGYCFHRFTVEHLREGEDFTTAAELITSVFVDGIVERNSKG